MICSFRFVDASEGAKVPPMDPAWMTFSELYGISTVQQMILGDVTVEQGLAAIGRTAKIPAITLLSVFISRLCVPRQNAVRTNFK